LLVRKLNSLYVYYCKMGRRCYKPQLHNKSRVCRMPHPIISPKYKFKKNRIVKPQPIIEMPVYTANMQRILVKKRYNGKPCFECGRQVFGYHIHCYEPTGWEPLPFDVYDDTNLLSFD
jgi:hypothetical protein